MKLLIPYLLLFLLPLVSSANWRQYPYQANGSDIVFPQDEGRHHGFPNTEWWYTVIHATGITTQHEYSILVTHFNNRFRFFTISDLTNKMHHSETKLGKLKSKSGSLNLLHYIEDTPDYFRSKKDIHGELIPFTYEFATHAPNMKLQANATAIKPPLMVNGDGYINIGNSGKSWYYSLTRMNVQGTLTFNGVTEQFTGLGWMDHQWGPFLVSPINILHLFETYEWFCLQLDDGTDIMISTIFNRKQQIPSTLDYASIQIVNSDGSSESYPLDNFKRLSFLEKPNKKNRYMSNGWQLSIPERDLKLILTPNGNDHMVDFPLGGSFFEGPVKVKGRIDHKRVEGRGFAELIHEYRKPKIKMVKLPEEIDLNKEVTLQWSLKNPDTGNPLQYDIYAIYKLVPVKIGRNISGNEFSLNKLTRKILQKVDNFRFKIVGKSIDGTIKGSVKSSIHTPKAFN